MRRVGIALALSALGACGGRSDQCADAPMAAVGGVTLRTGSETITRATLRMRCNASNGSVVCSEYASESGDRLTVSFALASGVTILNAPLTLGRDFEIGSLDEFQLATGNMRFFGVGPSTEWSGSLTVDRVGTTYRLNGVACTGDVTLVFNQAEAEDSGS